MSRQTISPETELLDISNLTEQPMQIEVRDDLGRLGLEQLGAVKQLRGSRVEFARR